MEGGAGSGEEGVKGGDRGVESKKWKERGVGRSEEK